MKRLEKTGVFMIALWVFALNTVFSQNFKPGTRLFTVSTSHFDIIYSASSEQTARLLAESAESIYERVSGLLGIALRRTVPVVITPDTGLYNAYMNPVPYPHIVLFDTPYSLEWTAFENSLESLFLHELTHALSGGTRSPALERLQSVFGWVYPSALNAPWFMVEGAAVSFESLNREGKPGITGRASDPFIKEKLRQDIYENRFKTPFQATGVYDAYPGNNIYYDYGGLFSAYLQNTYGMERYARLWKEIGAQIRISPFYYGNGFYAIFKNVYDAPFLSVWNDFKKSLALTGLVDTNTQRLSKNTAFIADVASGGGKIFYIDTYAGKLFAYDPAGGEPYPAVHLDGNAYALDVSPDGSYALISTYRRYGANAGQLVKSLVEEYNLHTGKRTGRSWEGVYQGRYFREGIVAIQSEGHRGHLVYLKSGGAAEHLLSGGEELVFSSPAPVNDAYIAFISAKKGIRELSLYNYETKTLSALKTNLPDDAARFQYMRGLRFSAGKLLFSYNHNDKMYKLAVVELGREGALSIQAPRISFSETELSGGIFNAVSASDGGIYYRGMFSSTDSLMQLESADTSAVAARFNNWENPISRAALASAEESSLFAAPFPSKPRRYSALKYANPFNLWFPFPNISITSNDIAINGVSIFSFIASPTDNNLFLISLGYDWKYTFAPVSVTWNSFALSVPLTTVVSDSIDESLQLFPIPRRTSAVSLNTDIRFPLANESYGLYLSPQIAMQILSWPEVGPTGKNIDYQREGSAYHWRYHDMTGAAALALTFTTIRRFPWQIFGNGFAGTLALRKAAVFIEPGETFIFKTSMNRYEAVIRAVQESLPLLSFVGAKFTAYGAYDPEGMTLQGSSFLYDNTFFSAAAASEYQLVRNTRNFLWWLSGAELELKLFSIEIQKNLSHSYINRLYMSTAWRAVYYGNQAPFLENTGGLLHSMILRLATPVSLTPLAVLPVKITPTFAFIYKMIALAESPRRFVFDIAVSIEY